MESLADMLVAIVDDNRTFVNLLRSILSDFGVRNVVDFSDVDDVVPYLETQFVSAMFLDLVMPKMTGLQLAHQIRHAPGICNRIMPVIMITGHADARNIQMAIKVGIDEILVKPVRPRDVRDKLLAAVNQPRVYIKTKSGYCGPDRRRRHDPLYRGAERRQAMDHEVFTAKGPQHVREIIAAAGVPRPGAENGAAPAGVPYSAAPLLRAAILKAGLPNAAPPQLVEPEFDRRYTPRPAEETAWSRPTRPAPERPAFSPAIPAPKQPAAQEAFSPAIPAPKQPAVQQAFSPAIPAPQDVPAGEPFRPAIPVAAEPAPLPKRSSGGRYFLD